MRTTSFQRLVRTAGADLRGTRWAARWVQLLLVALAACDPRADLATPTEAAFADGSGPLLAAASAATKLFALRVDPRQMALESGQSGSSPPRVVGTAATRAGWVSSDRGSR